MTSAPRVSVVIPTYQRRDALLRSLAALATQRLDADAYEVVVVVDGATDGSREAAESFDAPYALRVLSQPNRGRAAACNAGAAAARGTILVLLDDDMEATPQLLAAHAASHERACRDGGAVAVIGAAPIAVQDDAPAHAAYIARKFNRHLEHLAQAQGNFTLRDFYSGNLSLRRDVFLSVGGFDEAFVEYGNEDLELSIRLRAAGVRLVYDADAAATQSYDKSFAALARDNVAKGRTAVLLSRMHPAAHGDLKLGTYAREPLVRRVAIATLVGATRLRPDTFAMVSRAASWMGDRRVPGVGRLYPILLDYCYWWGVHTARTGA
jgi:GT2 family glycosyltransferase